MKKRIGLYSVVWVILLALYNALAIISVKMTVQEKYTSTFWVVYAFTTLMFVGQYICTLFAFKADSANKVFYRISLIKTSYAGLVCSLIFGGISMIISPRFYWVGVALCVIVLAANIFSVIKATGAIVEVERVDEKVKEQTLFIKSLTVDADTLMTSAKSEAVKAECKKVYEAIRYSDPMSSNALASVEAQITIQFHALSEAVESDDADLVVAIAKNLTVLINDRNKKCNLLK